MRFKNKAIEIVESGNFDKIDELKEYQSVFVGLTDKLKKKQLKRIKKKEDPTKASMLFINILQESKTLALSIVSAVKSYRDFRKNY